MTDCLHVAYALGLSMFCCYLRPYQFVALPDVCLLSRRGGIVKGPLMLELGVLPDVGGPRARHPHICLPAVVVIPAFKSSSGLV